MSWKWTPAEQAFLVAQLVKNRLQCSRPGFNPWVGKIPWRRESLPTPEFWPGEFHGLYSSWGSQRVVHGWATFTYHFPEQSTLARKRSQASRDLQEVVTIQTMGLDGFCRQWEGSPMPLSLLCILEEAYFTPENIIVIHLASWAQSRTESCSRSRLRWKLFCYWTI